MKTQSRVRIALSSLVVAPALFQSAFAQLPSHNSPPWLGYFAAHANNRFQFAITSSGEMLLTPVDSKGPVNNRLAIVINPAILETLPDGKTVTKQLIVESLESTDTITDKLEKTTFRGKVTGGSSFEINVEQSRGFVLVGGRILDPGSAKNPLRFTLSAKIPDLYRDNKVDVVEGEDKREAEREQKKRVKDFLKKIKDDDLSLKWTDDKRLKHKLEETVDLSAAEVNGPGIAELELESGAYQDRKIQFTASPNSSMTLLDAKLSPIYKGFTIRWTPDPAKDPDAKARLAISCR